MSKSMLGFLESSGACLLFAVLAACAHTPVQTSAAPPAVDEDPYEWPPAVPRMAADGFVAFACDFARSPEEIQIDRRRRADELGFDAELDYVSLARAERRQEVERFAVRGQPCNKAFDRQTCLATVAELELAALEQDGTFAITTRGADVAVHRGTELAALVTPIDSVAKAWLVLMTKEPVASYLCGDVDWNGYRRDGSAFELLWYFTRSNCEPYEQVRTVTRVDSRASVRRASRTVKRTEGRCVVDETGWR